MNTYSQPSVSKPYLTAFSCAFGLNGIKLRLVLDQARHHELSVAETWDQIEKWGPPWGVTEFQLQQLKEFKQQYTPHNYLDFLDSQQLVPILDTEIEYPSLLLLCDDRPMVLFVKGNPQCWEDRPIAVVGTRRMTTYGDSATSRLVRELVAAHCCIVSGFMHGIDVKAHQTALLHGGRTVGVLGYGFGHLQDQRHYRLADTIVSEGGALVSELPFMTSPAQYTFPMRNRIIAGMSHATVVVEAAVPSGSLITANLAADYNRPVCAVPGPITNRFSEGTKLLINDGATFVSTGSDITKEAGFATDSPVEDKQLFQAILSRLTDLERRIVMSIYDQHLTTDELVTYLGQSVVPITASLTILEVQGLIKRKGEVWLPA